MKNNNINIRIATVKDVNILAQLEMVTWQKTYVDILPHSYIKGLNFVHIKEKFLKRFAFDTIQTYIIYIEKAPIGYFVLTKITNKRLEISKFYILPSYQSRGIGQYCYNKIFQTAVLQNFSKVEVWIVNGNKHSIGFHEKMGFVNCNQQRPIKSLNQHFLCKFVTILSNIGNPTRLKVDSNNHQD